MLENRRSTGVHSSQAVLVRRLAGARGSATLSIVLSVLAFAAIVLSAVVAVRRGGLHPDVAVLLIGALVIEAATAAEASRAARTARHRRRLAQAHDRHGY